MLKEKRNQKLRIRMTCFSFKTENDSQQERRKKSCSRRRRRRRRRCFVSFWKQLVFILGSFLALVLCLTAPYFNSCQTKKM